MQMSLASGTRSDALGRCHVCGAKVVVKSAGEVVIKNAILKVDGASGRVTAKCSHCKAWVAHVHGIDQPKAQVEAEDKSREAGSQRRSPPGFFFVEEP
jgi:hypothetical protein